MKKGDRVVTVPNCSRVEKHFGTVEKAGRQYPGNTGRSVWVRMDYGPLERHWSQNLRVVMEEEEL